MPRKETAVTETQPVTTDGQPVPTVTLVRVEGKPRITNAAAGVWFYAFGEGDGPWTMDADLWRRLSADPDIAASFAVKEN